MTKDKVLHFYVGFFIALVVGLFSPAIGYGLALMAGLSKELYDKWSKKGTPEEADFIWTALGGAAGTITYLV